MFNEPIKDQNEIMNFKNNRRNLIETLERNHYKTVCNKIRRRRYLIDMHLSLIHILTIVSNILSQSELSQLP